MLSGFTFALHRRSRVPVYRQLYHRTRAAIASGQLRSGERLPSTRSLAAQLGTARGMVDAAYAMLAAEGWIVARGPAGTIVAPDLAEKLRDWAPTSTAAQPGASNGLTAEMPPRPFRMGLPALDAFPRKLWSRLVAHEARALSSAGMANPDPAGYGKLRESIAAYLAIARGVSLHAAPSVRDRWLSGRAKPGGPDTDREGRSGVVRKSRLPFGTAGFDGSRCTSDPGAGR
jgi:GntR family transcriptional regulator / MocR family aminotransferase